MKEEITVGSTEWFGKGMSDPFAIEWIVVFPNFENGEGCSFGLTEDMYREDGKQINKSRNCEVYFSK